MISFADEMTLEVLGSIKISASMVEGFVCGLFSLFPIHLMCSSWVHLFVCLTDADFFGIICPKADVDTSPNENINTIQSFLFK